jgi:hypothetical protein
VSAEYCVTSCDLGVFVDEAAPHATGRENGIKNACLLSASR